MVRRQYFSILTGVLWGTVYPGIVIALQSLTALQFAFLRVTLAALTLGGVVAWVRSKQVFQMDRTVLARLGVLSLLGVGVFYLAQTYAVDFSTPINVSFIIASHPLLVAVLAPLVLDEGVGYVDLGGLAVAMAGVYLIIGDGRLIPLFSSQTVVGDLIAFVGATTFAIYLVMHRKWSSQIDAGQLTLTFFILGGAVPLLAIPVVSAGEYAVDISPMAAAALLWIAIVATTGGYLALNLGLSEETSVITALRLLMIPFVSTIVSAVVLGEAVTSIHLIGGFAIAIGVAAPHLSDRFATPSG